ncbi:glycosyltransferase family 2 protein [Bacillus sp. Marseille-P3661]|uniref:glycosyltransferase family 2 protein n=1 Tax=Bacillus sp. Marseille-P3661 TaxID=1936234 RepID=UPI000C865D20|nr:glycosyltransferase family 2 protein [Bacillus sp. Marseille-P3661]
MEHPVLTIVVPCYNEEEIFPDSVEKLTIVLKELINEELISPKSKLLFVDDGSRDRTWTLIAKETIHNTYVGGLKLARNVGHQKALLAGLERANQHSDCVISIDADLQDDISVIREFITKFLDGYDIVYGVRKGRKTDTLFKRTTAIGFYRVMNKIGIQLIPNHADFRLMSKRAIDELSKYNEANVFLRGMIPLIGFRTINVYYDRKERLAGESKYPLKKMLSFAFDGLTSFSTVPIRYITIIGFMLFLFSGIAGMYAMIQKFTGNTNSGWTSLIISIWFLGGLQLMGLGLIGEYIGKIFIEVKRRPKYAVDIDLFSDPFEHLQNSRSADILASDHRLFKRVQE